MISFRYHIVSIVSVFLALAVGVALGGGPLKGEVDNTLVQQVQADRQTKADLQAEITSLRGGNSFNDSFASTVAPGLLSGTLTGRPVTLLVLPGAQEGTVSSLSTLIGEAGGSVAGTVRVGQAALDAGNKQLVDELGSQLLDSTPDVTVPANAGGYERMGALLARAVGTDEDAGAPVDEAANSIMSGFSTAGLTTVDGQMNRRGSLVLVVAGATDGTSSTQEGADAIMVTLAKALDADTDGVVVAGPLASAKDGGIVYAVRKDVLAARDVSTVDVLGRVAGDVVTVMALGEQAKGTTGHYGVVDAADGTMPGAAPAGQ